MSEERKRLTEEEGSSAASATAAGVGAVVGAVVAVAAAPVLAPLIGASALVAVLGTGGLAALGGWFGWKVGGKK
jgi:hypothetical protein